MDISEYKKEIAEVQSIGFGLDRVLNIDPRTVSDDTPESNAITDLLQEEIETIFAPLSDESIDPGDKEKIINTYFERHGVEELEVVRKEVKLHRQLFDLYDYLERTASEEEWIIYAKLCFEMRLKKQMPLMLTALKELKGQKNLNSD
jgi:hypothetical protein